MNISVDAGRQNFVNPGFFSNLSDFSSLHQFSVFSKVPILIEPFLLLALTAFSTNPIGL